MLDFNRHINPLMFLVYTAYFQLRNLKMQKTYILTKLHILYYYSIPSGAQIVQQVLQLHMLSRIVGVIICATEKLYREINYNLYLIINFLHLKWLINYAVSMTVKCSKNIFFIFLKVWVCTFFNCMCSQNTYLII